MALESQARPSGSRGKSVFFQLSFDVVVKDVNTGLSLARRFNENATFSIFLFFYFFISFFLIVYHANKSLVYRNSKLYNLRHLTINFSQNRLCNVLDR